MRPLLLLIFCFFFTVAQGQNLKLGEIEKKIINSKNLDYHSFLQKRGFNLLESSKEGKNGVYEKWQLESQDLYLTIQTNGGMGFTKLTFSSGTEDNKPVVDNLINDINKNYSNQTINNQTYYIKEENPETTVHLIKIKRNGRSVDGVLFFHKY